MTARRLVIIGLCLAVVIAAVALVFDQLARQGSTSAQNPPSSSQTSGTTGGSSTGGAGAPTAGSPTSGGSTSSPTGGTGTGEPSTAPLLEVLPPVTSTPTGLPAPSTPAPLITGELPAPGTANGAVVDGWPGGILTLPEGTTVGSTSISTSGDVLQLTADGIVGRSPEDVLGSFRQTLVQHGFWSEDAPAPDGAVAARFVRGTDTVTVSVSVTGTGSSRFQLLGSLHMAAD